jgi:hypothetical protein
VRASVFKIIPIWDIVSPSFIRAALNSVPSIKQNPLVRNHQRPGARRLHLFDLRR